VNRASLKTEYSPVSQLVEQMKKQVARP
jgi:hypothetical protein